MKYVRIAIGAIVSSQRGCEADEPDSQGQPQEAMLVQGDRCDCRVRGGGR